MPLAPLKGLSGFLSQEQKHELIRRVTDAIVRGGPACLDRMFQFLSGASRCSAYAAVCRAGRLSPLGERPF